MTLCAARLSATSYVVVISSCLACIKTDVEAHEMIQNCELVHSINREKLYQLILWQKFIQSRASVPMFILGEMLSKLLAALQRKIVLMKLLKLIRR